MERFTSTAGMDLGLGLGLGNDTETEDEKRKRLRMQGMGDQSRGVFGGSPAARSLLGQSPLNWFGGR